jgi:hypothetical protein
LQLGTNMKLCIAIASLWLVACSIDKPSESNDADATVANPELAYSSLSVFDTNVEPAAWDSATYRVVYNRRGADHLWDAYTANADGTDEQCVTCALPDLLGAGTATNRGASDITPDGKWLLVAVEKGRHPGAIGDSITDPGRGVYNDLWLVRSDGSAAYPLTGLPTAANVAVIWPRFDRTGTSIVWSQMYAGVDLGHLLGQWQLKVGDLDLTGFTPALVNVRTFSPEAGRFYEPYGFGPDNDTIIFASDIGMASAFESKIWTTNRELSTLQRLAPIDATGPFADYDEFAFFIPGADRILFARTYQATSAGMDWWTMRSDGSDVRRVTYLDEPWTVESTGYSLLGGLAFDPRDSHRVFVGRTTDGVASNEYEGLMIDLATYGDGHGLTEIDYADTRMTTQSARGVVATVERQWSDAFTASRWTGQLVPPLTGTYKLCLEVDDVGSLYIGGNRVVQAWLSGLSSACTSMTLTANTQTSLRVDVANYAGQGRAYLSWTRPDGVTETVPASALRPQ